MKIKLLTITILLFCGISLFGQMATDLRTLPDFPLTDPYDGLVTIASVPADVVDWVKVVLRTGTAGSTAVDSAYGFVMSNGDIKAVDGTSDLAFENAAPGSYYAVVYHRNHLAIMSAATIDITSGSATYDFTDAENKFYGTVGQKAIQIGSTWWVPGGDTNESGIVTLADFDPIIADNNLSGYRISDANMSGITTLADFDVVITANNMATQVP